MPNVGDTKFKFGRRYQFLNPDPALGPGTWRLSMPEEYPGAGGGGGAINGIDGVEPINADTDIAGVTTITFDIEELDDRDP